MRRLMKFATVAVAVGAAGWAWSAGAQPHRRMAAAGPCQADIEKFCKDVQVGGGRMRQCMQEHQKDLSSECLQYMQSMHSRAAGRGGWSAACGADVEKFCKDVRPGRGGIYQCLKGHEAELSDSCKSAMAGAAAAVAKPAPGTNPAPTEK